MSIPVDVPANAAAAGGGAGGGASSSNPPPAPPPATQLAPGFRFHPTDEELVRYYLKRKVSGRELRVDAIAEVDLYKCEPWDLPSRSRIRSRDMEWYFFSPLDRKYANKSRTNRATSHGYWKTTGKDRPVKQGPRTVGMKKTLVFHAGRAPRGERTNWVMHEYRLDDEELARAGVAQDAYVVCRIFQKSGAGPQNGAQYGAPFIEEEWEEDEGMVMMRDGDDDELNDAVGHEYLQLADFVPNQDVDNQQEKAAIPAVGSDKAAIPAVGSDRQDNGSQPEDAVILLEEILSEPTFVGGDELGFVGDMVDELGFVGDMVDELGFVGDMVEYPTQPLQQAGMVISDMGENTDIADCSCGPPSGSNEYMELTDFVDAGNADYPLGEDSIGPIFRTSYDQKSVNDINLGEMFDIEEFFNTSNENMDQPELSQMHPTSQDNTYMLPGHQLKPLPGDHPSDQLANDNLVFYDAPNGDLAFTEDNIVRLNDVLPSPVAQSSVENFDTVDEWMAYFDATDDFHYDTTNTFMEESRHLNPSILDHLNNTEEVNTNHVLTNNAAPQASGANNANGASTSARSHEFDSQYNSKNDKATFAPDIQRNYSDDKTITKRLVNMLGSISAPPALAAEFPARSEKSVGQVSAMHSAGSTIHFTAGMIQIHGLTLTGSAEHWSLQKNEDVGVLLSYSMAANDVVGKSAGFEPITKMQGGAVSMVLRGGFCLFFLSALILTVSYKVGICICSR